MQIFTPKHAQFDSFIERGKFLMSYRLTLIFSLVFLAMTLTQLGADIFAVIGYLSAFIISSGALIYLSFTKRYKHLFLFYAISGTLLTHFAINTSQTTQHYVDFLWMIVASFLAFLGVGKKWGLIILSANTIGSFYFIFFSHNIHLKVMSPFTTTQAVIAYTEIVLAFFTIGYLMYQFIVFQNYSESKLQKANAELNIQNNLIRSKNHENNTLVKEIHHRVKNNLQIIISLLRLQQSEIETEEARKHFTEAINRVLVMASIHTRLYKEKEITRIDLEAYLKELAEDLNIIFQIDKNIEVDINCDYNEIDLKTVVPLGLLLNELISNSFKYAFAEKNEGKISIAVKEMEHQFSLVYSDSGKWLESTKTNSGFGLDLIQILTEQLNGTFTMSTGNTGTTYKFILSKLE